jgi:hypothetical protein
MRDNLRFSKFIILLSYITICYVISVVYAGLGRLRGLEWLGLRVDWQGLQTKAIAGIVGCLFSGFLIYLLRLSMESAETVQFLDGLIEGTLQADFLAVEHRQGLVAAVGY